MSSLGSLVQATDQNVAVLDDLQDGVQRNTADVQDLLVKGEAAQKVEAIIIIIRRRSIHSPILWKSAYYITLY